VPLWNKKAALVSATTLALLGGPAAAAKAPTTTIVVRDGSKHWMFRRFPGGTVGSFLKQSGLAVSPRDRIYPSPETPLRGSMNITIEHPKRVCLADGDGRETIDTFAATVDELLREQGISLGPLDQVSVALDTPVSDGMVVQIQRVVQTVTKSKRVIPFQTVRRKSSRLNAGQQRVLTRGVEGWLETEIVTVYVNGRKVRQVTSQHLVQAPVTQVILVGTKPQPPASFTTLTARPSRDAGAGHFVRRLTVEATAYVAGGRTATGAPAEPGVIAVDPNVIPLGSRLYIPGFGTVVAADTGGAIRGNRIDICMASERQAEAWGRRVITVYVVSEPQGN
jgi:3D (Asp-Asp-Asp) domain-containing protein